MHKTITMHVHGGRGWVAEITGRDQKFGLARKFLAKRDVTNSGSVYRELEFAIPLTEGTIYEYSEQASARRTVKGFWHVQSGDLVAIERSDVEASLG